MELRTTEEKINELIAAYEGIRGSPILQPEHHALLPSTPAELVAKAKSSTPIGDAKVFVGSLRRTKEQLTDLQSKVEKFRKRLFEIDPVTEKPRYGPKSQARVRLLVAKNDFLCSQYAVNFPEQYRNQCLRLEEYKQQQLLLREQRQEQRRQEFLKEQERLKQKEEEKCEDADSSAEETKAAMRIDANMNSDGSIIVTKNDDMNKKNEATLSLNPTEASPASLLFAELEQQYETQQQAKQREEDSKEQARLQQEEEKKRKIVEEEAKQKALEAQQAAERAEEEEARTQRLHQQAEEARLRRRAQEEARKQAEREWLDGIKKGAEGVRHYLDVVLQRSASEEGKDIDPERLVALESLCTLFDQIQKHPEEVNKRKIKLSNPNFHRDIGQHEGAIELLVAAGFRPTMLPVEVADNDGGDEAKNNNDEEEQPDIAFLISKEPNLEHDMDGWMAWFDLNKATLEILQTELQKVQGSKRSRR